MLPSDFLLNYKELPEDFRQRVAQKFATDLERLIHFDSAEVEEIFGASENTIRSLRTRGTRIGKRIKPSMKDLLDYVEDHKVDRKEVIRRGKMTLAELHEAQKNRLSSLRPRR